MEMIVKASYMSYLPELFNQFAKTAAKVKCEKPSYKIVKSYTLEKDDFHGYVVDFIFPDIIGFGNVEFVAIIDHLAEGVNVVRKLVHNADFVYQENYCHHCKVKRSRKSTLIIRNENGEFLQVGKSCAKDFFGHDLYSKLCDFLNPPDNGFSEDENGFRNGSASYFDLHWTLAISVAVIREYDFIKLANSTPAAPATSQRVKNQLLGIPPNQREATPITPVSVTDSDLEQASKLIEWIRTQDGTRNDYINNLQNICKLDYVLVKHLGMLASLPQAFNNSVKREIAKAIPVTQTGASEFLGKVGERLTLTVTIKNSIAIATDFGTSYLWIMRDDKGNNVTSFNSGGFSAHVGETLTIKGTVKEHSIYKEEKQTKLSRIKAV